MLIPLVLALFVKARFSEIAARIRSFTGKLTNISVLLLLVAVFVLFTKTIISNANVLPVILLFFLGAMMIGFVTGGKRRDVRLILLVGAGQRNPPVAMLVASQNFSTEPMAAITPLLAAIMGLLILIPVASRIGKREELHNLTYK